jgi:cytochrome P450
VGLPIFLRINQFGGGSRICIGKHLGLLEVYKVLATLVSRYNIDFIRRRRFSNSSSVSSFSLRSQRSGRNASASSPQTEGGLDLPNGLNIPAGCVVGMNPYVVARNKSVWGEPNDRSVLFIRRRRFSNSSSVSSFSLRSQRSGRNVRLMNNTDLSFGGGSRICIGKHLGLLEVYKVLATVSRILPRFRVSHCAANAPAEMRRHLHPRQTYCAQRTDLSFGGGSRICIGKHLGLLEVYKVLATLVSRYNIVMELPHQHQ